MLKSVVTLFVGLIALTLCVGAAESFSEPILYAVTINSDAVRADEELEGDILSRPDLIRILNLGPAINHKGLDYGPTVSADGKTLYFVSNRKGSRITRDGDFSHDFWAAKKENNLDTVFFPPYNIDTVDAGVNTIQNEGVASIAVDRQTLYFTGCDRKDGLGDCDIYVTEIQGDRWGTPRNLGRNVNSEYWDSQPAISPGKDRLYFSSNRPSPTNPDGGGSEDMDIWYADWDDDLGEWKKAVNLGPDINTSKQEVAPFIAADGNTLFFSSNGHKPNMGGLDFYKTSRTGQKDREGRDRWTKPQQLPAPINTKEDDQFITLPASGDVVYFSSRRRDLPNWQGDLDVFMAFIPKFFRVVNVIVDVIDECTGLHVPAAVTLKNNKTGKSSTDTLTLTTTETSIYVNDADYGVGAAKSDQITYTATAVSPTYGERSITIDVTDPGKTFDQNKQDSNIVIRKTIMLGRRPTLTAQIGPSEEAKRKNSSWRGLVLEERATVILYPLLPYIFFDLNQSTFASRYTIFRSPSQTQGFNDERLPGSTLQKYYHVLNIYGYRLTKYPNVKVEITGCVDEINEDKNSPLPMKRAELVRDYLRTIWKIDDSRITVKAMGWPKERSNPKDSFGIVENRRAELRFSGEPDDVWHVSKPILDNDPTTTPSPDIMTWNMTNGIDDKIVASRRIEVWRNGTSWNVLDKIGNTAAAYDWDWLDKEGEYPKEGKNSKDPEQNLPGYTAQLVVVSANGTECRSDSVHIPVRRLSSRTIATTTEGSTTKEKYNLILFDFDSYNPGDMNKRILKEFVYPRVKASTTIKVEGHTDVVGEYNHNKKLSENRARVTKDLVNSGSAGYKTLESVGTGEDDPLYTNDLPEGRFFNRTVQVQLETPLTDAEIDR